MTKLEGSGGGAVGKLWREHGGGYYALLAVGTFVYLEIHSFIEAFMSSEDVGDFVRSELLSSIFTFGIETVINSFLAGIWPFMWMSWMSFYETLAWAGGGYLVWAVVLAIVLDRRERALRKELGL